MSAKVIPYSFWLHPATGRKASIYGAHPATGAVGNKHADWVVKTEGFTIAWPDGTTGTGRLPFANAELAQAHIDRNPRFPGMSQG